MAKKKALAKRQLMQWSDFVPASDVQDPLGLALRGSTRVASQLLHCITTITPRARYFSFLPWCVLDFQENEQGQPFALGLKEAIRIREKVLTYGSVLHHNGSTCDGGNLIGSTSAANWISSGTTDAKLKELPFAINLALGAYFNSLVNLGFFKTDEEREDTGEEVADKDLAFDDIQLSDLGMQLASAYDATVGSLSAINDIASMKRVSSATSLREFGEHGGLCELRGSDAPDLGLLRDVFLARQGFRQKSHWFRNRTLTLIMDLCRQISADDWALSEANFSSAVYFDRLIDGEDKKAIEWPAPLSDIALRWRMFYFHHYMAVALEALLSWLITNVNEFGVSGTTIDNLMDRLRSKVVSKFLAEELSTSFPANLGDANISDLFKCLGIEAENLDEAASRELDSIINADHPVAEHVIERLIRKGTYLHSAEGLALPCILLALTLSRYFQWHKTDHGNWLATSVKDRYLDLVPPLLIDGLEEKRNDWWQMTWCEFANLIVSRYVVQQHITMAYEKSAAADRCLLQKDGENVATDCHFEKVGMGNGRLGSAILILKDLRLLADDDNGGTYVTPDGITILSEELEREDES